MIKPLIPAYRYGKGRGLGFDSGKQVKSRKRQILVDTMGSLLKVVCLAANMADAKGARQRLERLPIYLWKRLKRIWADGGYRGDLADWLHNQHDVMPWRWIVERTFCLARSLPMLEQRL